MWKNLNHYKVLNDRFVVKTEVGIGLNLITVNDLHYFQTALKLKK